MIRHQDLYPKRSIIYYYYIFIILLAPYFCVGAQHSVKGQVQGYRLWLSAIWQAE